MYRTNTLMEVFVTAKEKAPSIWKLVSLKSSKNKHKSSLCLTNFTQNVYLTSWLINNSTQAWIFKATSFTLVLCTLVSQKKTPTNQRWCYIPSNQTGTWRAVSFRTSGTTERKFCCCSTWWRDIWTLFFGAPSKMGSKNMELIRGPYIYIYIYISYK